MRWFTDRFIQQPVLAIVINIAILLIGYAYAWRKGAMEWI